MALKREGLDNMLVVCSTLKFGTRSARSLCHCTFESCQHPKECIFGPRIMSSHVFKEVSARCSVYPTTSFAMPSGTAVAVLPLFSF